jgi:hypothetical protein
MEMMKRMDYWRGDKTRDFIAGGEWETCKPYEVYIISKLPSNYSCCVLKILFAVGVAIYLYLSNVLFILADQLRMPYRNGIVMT